MHFIFRFSKLSVLFLLVFSCSFAQKIKLHNLDIVVTGLKNTNGQLMISLSKGKQGFPHNNYYKQIFIPDFTSPEFNITIKGIPNGNYAVSLLHDEDSNGKMNRNLIRIPKEGFAFSRNYKVLLRAPKYEEANFDIDTIKKPVVIKLQY